MQTKIIARDGYILTNGTIYGVEIYLGNGVSSDDFREITIDEYNRLMESKEE